MKKLYGWLLSLGSIIIFTACSLGAGNTPPPSETVTAFLAHIQAVEFAEADELILGDISLYEIEEEHRGMFANLSHEHISESINGSQASVTLTINAVDFVAVMDEVMVEAFYLAFTEISAAELAILIETALIEGMTSSTAPIASSEVTVTLEMSDGEWKIIADDTFVNAVTGGFFSFAAYADEWLPD